MKKFLFIISMLVSVVTFSQSTGFFRYDTVTFQKIGGNSEFNLLNSTRGVTGGVLTNIGNGRTAFVMPSGGGGSSKANSGVRLFGDTVQLGGSLIKATTINGAGFPFNIKAIDSVQWNSNTGFAQPDTLYGVGHSFVNSGTGSTIYDSTTEGRAAAGYSLPYVNMGFSGAGVLVENQIANARIYPGNRGMVVYMGVDNDAWRGSPLTPDALTTIKTTNKILNGLKSLYINFYLKLWVPSSSSSVVKTGTWSTFTPTTYGGKSAVGQVTQTANDSIVYTFSGQSNVAWTMIACDSVTVAGARFTAVIYEYQFGGALVSSTTYGTNNQTNGITDAISGNNARTPMGFIVSGLNPNKTYKLKLVSNQSTNFLYVDYFGHLVDAAYAKPMIWFHPVKATAAGYTTLGTGYNDAMVTLFSSKMDSLKTVQDGFGLPLYMVASNTYYDPATGASGDGFHPSDAGYRHLYNGLLATFPSLQLASNGTIFNGNGQTYSIINRNARTVGIDPGTGITFNSGLAYNNLSTGVPGGQTLNFGTLTGDGGVINTNPLHDGSLLFGTSTTWVEATNRIGLGTTVPNNTLHIVNTGANSADIVRIDGIASQSGDFIRMRDNLGNIRTRIGGGVAVYGQMAGSMSGTGGAFEFDAGSNTLDISSITAGVGYHNIVLHGAVTKINNAGTEYMHIDGSSVKLQTVPSGLGTKALRFNPATGAVTYADTTTGGGGGGSGTVTSVDLAYGITGSTDPITTTGTVIADTTILVNKAGAQVISGSKNFVGTQAFNNDVTFNNDILFNTTSKWVASSSRLGIGELIPLTSLHVVNTGANSANVVTIDGIASQSGDYIRMRDNSGNTKARIGPGIQVFGLMAGGASGLGGALEWDGGSNTFDISAIEAGVGYHNMVLHGSTVKINNAGTEYMAVNSTGMSLKAGLVGVGGNLKTNTTQVGNVGAGEDDLMTYAVPANTLAVDGDYLEFEMVFHATTGATKTIRGYFGSQLMFSYGPIASVVIMVVRGKIVRTGAATQFVSLTMSSNSGSWAYSSEIATATETLSGAVTLKGTGTATSNDDIMQKLMTVKYYPAK